MSLLSFNNEEQCKLLFIIMRYEKSMIGLIKVQVRRILSIQTSGFYAGLMDYSLNNVNLRF
jgi:hypothetical protein